jgi:hypothetical protein
MWEIFTTCWEGDVKAKRGRANLARSMVGPAGTRQPVARRTQACRRACPAHDAGVHLRPRLRPANSLSAVRIRGRRAVVKDDVGVLNLGGRGLGGGLPPDASAGLAAARSVKSFLSRKMAVCLPHLPLSTSAV